MVSGAATCGATVSGAATCGATVSGATASGATASGATVSGATVSGTTVSGTTVSGATVSGATVSGASDASGAVSAASTVAVAIGSVAAASGDATDSVSGPSGAAIAVPEINACQAIRCCSLRMPPRANSVSEWIAGALMGSSRAMASALCLSSLATSACCSWSSFKRFATPGAARATNPIRLIRTCWSVNCCWSLRIASPISSALYRIGASRCRRSDKGRSPRLAMAWAASVCRELIRSVNSRFWFSSRFNRRSTSCSRISARTPTTSG